MFPCLPVIRKPNSLEAYLLPQVIDMPVGTLDRAKVMSEAGSYASWPECAADIDVVTRLEP
jgi:hypothetical protein